MFAPSILVELVRFDFLKSKFFVGFFFNSFSRPIIFLCLGSLSRASISTFSFKVNVVASRSCTFLTNKLTVFDKAILSSLGLVGRVLFSLSELFMVETNEVKVYLQLI